MDYLEAENEERLAHEAQKRRDKKLRLKDVKASWRSLSRRINKKDKKKKVGLIIK